MPQSKELPHRCGDRLDTRHSAMGRWHAPSGHHSQVATICRADTCYVVVTAVRITWILSVVVLRNDVVVILWLWQVETALAVSYPDTELITAQATEHHTVVLRNGQTEECTLELLGCVVAEV